MHPGNLETVFVIFLAPVHFSKNNSRKTVEQKPANNSFSNF